MGYCSVSNCLNCSSKGDCSSKGITFHCFPKDPDVKEKWILAAGRKNWFPTKYSRICSVHFQENDFDPTRKLRVLMKHAYPTIDVWTTANSVADDKPKVTPSTPSSPLLSSKAKRALEVDPDSPETSSKRKMQLIINVKDNIIKTQQLKIKSLQTKIRRYEKKITELKEIVKELESNRRY